MWVAVFVILAVASAVPVEKPQPALEQTTFEAVPAFKRNSVISNLAKQEQEAGRAVLKLLDAKIGSKVQDAAKEVTAFLASAIGHHADQRTEKLRQDKVKEMSLLHLGANKVISAHKIEKVADKPKKRKDGSFLVHFKIPYIVTPIKTRAHHKKHHSHHKHHKHHYHHHHHQHHAPHHAADPAVPPPIEHRRPFPPAVHAPYNSPSYGTPGASPYGTPGVPPYGALPNIGGMTDAGMAPCQGMCMAPCTPGCSLNSDCCCCPTSSAAVPPAPIPLGFSPPPLLPPHAPLMTATAPQMCMPGCRRHCYIHCPMKCCGLAKRSEVTRTEGSAEEEASGAEQQEAEGSGSEPATQQQNTIEDTGNDETGPQQQAQESHGNEPATQ